MRYLTISAVCLLMAALHMELRAQGQQGSGNPYSAYGFGTLLNTPQVEQAAMGGVGIALADAYGLNMANPASYPSLVLTNFQTAAAIRFLRFDSEDRSVNGSRLDLLGISVGVPFGRGRWGMSLGITPMSDVGYRISDTKQVAEGPVTFEYLGNGGLNRGYIGLGRTLWQSNDTLNKGTKVSLGIDLNYVFGSIEEGRKAFYPAGAGYYNTRVTSDLALNGPVIRVGLQWAGDLMGKVRMVERRQARIKQLTAVDQRKEQEWLDAGKDPAERRAVHLPQREAEAWRFRVGATVEIPSDLRAEYDITATNFSLSNAGVEITLDTAWAVQGSSGHVTLPLQWGLGFAMYNSRWTFTGEYKQRDWSDLGIDVEGYEQRSVLRTRGTAAVGVSYQPSGNGNGSFVERVTYRAGARYTEDYLVVAGTPLNEVGVSLGFSLPVMFNTTRSRLTFGAELGERGTSTDGNIRERFAAVLIGISITPDFREQWFRKRRID